MKLEENNEYDCHGGTETVHVDTSGGGTVKILAKVDGMPNYTELANLTTGDFHIIRFPKGKFKIVKDGTVEVGI